MNGLEPGTKTHVRFDPVISQQIYIPSTLVLFHGALVAVAIGALIRLDAWNCALIFEITAVGASYAVDQLALYG